MLSDYEETKTRLYNALKGLSVAFLDRMFHFKFVLYKLTTKINLFTPILVNEGGVVRVQNGY